MQPANLKPFLFDVSFDDEMAMQERKRKEEAARLAEEEARAYAEANPPAPTFSEDEMLAAKAQAWAEGHAAGLAEAEQSQAAKLNTLTENLAAEISGIHIHQDVANERLAADACELGVRVSKHLLPAYAEKHGLDEVRSVLTECFENLAHSAKIVITTAPENRETLEEHVQNLAARSGFEGRLLLLEDNSLGPAEISVNWDGGGLERSEEMIWNRLDQVMERLHQNLPPKAAREMPTEAEPTNETPAPTQEEQVADPAQDAPADPVDTTIAEEAENV